MNVLVACEYSGRVRDAFRKLGHEAVSVDLLDSEAGPPHVIGDVFETFETLQMNGLKFDLVIAHPPCTYLCNSGVRWLKPDYRKCSTPFERELEDDRAYQRRKEMLAAREFFLRLYNLPVPRICIENPIPHRHATLPKYSQIIQPWQFGHGETKATCLWLRGLEPLQPTKIVAGRVGRIHKLSPGENRWKERSRTYEGIARAMAEQWGGKVRKKAAS